MSASRSSDYHSVPTFGKHRRPPAPRGGAGAGARSRPFGPALLVAVLALLAAAAAPPQRSEADATALLEGLQQWLDGTHDLQGRFSQEMVSGALGAGPPESGRVWLRRPGRMRWDYLDPERKVALVRDGETLLYVEEDRQLIRGRLDDDDGLLPALFIGEQRLGELFRPQAAATEDGPDDKLGLLRLVPRGEAEGLEHVTLTLRLPSHEIEAAEVLDSAGNRIVYRFTRLRRNRGIDAAVFDFEPPPGTEVLGQP